VMRVIIMIPATPGGSGVAELSFIAMNCDYLPEGLASAVAIIWRLFNFYLYLAIGAVVLPRWIVRVNRNNQMS
jgi:glycosyltransferase 2 family protein